MSATNRFSLSSPESRGAVVVQADEFRSLLDSMVLSAKQSRALCALLMVRVQTRDDVVCSDHDLNQAAQIISRLVRQPDAVGLLEHGTLAIAMSALERRGDAYVMIDRLESFAEAAHLPWTFTSGVGVHPFCGGGSVDLWSACERDLEGAMSSDTWEHHIPRDTLMTRSTA